MLIYIESRVMIAKLGGCGDVINFGAVNLGQLKDLGNLVG
jgi:hypothetical protein